MWPSVVVAAWLSGLCLGASTANLMQPSNQDSPCLSPNSSSSSIHLGCSLDATCHYNGNCCHDSQYYDEAQQTRHLNDFVCVEYYQQESRNDGLCKEHRYVKATCTEEWNNTDVQALCLKGNTIPDILRGVPVRSAASGYTYVNAYCAICNGEDPWDFFIDVWESYVVCDGTPVAAARDDDYTVYDANTDSLPPQLYPSTESDDYDYSADYYDYSADYYNYSADYHDYSIDYYENYTIMYNEGTWGVIPPGLGVSAFIPCHTTFFNTIYKSESCEAPLPPGIIPSHSTLTMRLSVNLYKCFPDEVYDRESQKCKKIICPNPGEKFRYGRCAPKQGDATPSTQEQELLCSLSHTCFVPIHDGGCFCDASCKVYGDCCHDSQYYDEAQQTRNLSVCVECYQKKSLNGVDGLCKEHTYMKATCSEHWNNTDVQALCMKGNTIPDILNGFPISKVSGRTYVNAYCAICNGEDLVYVHRWESYVVCDGTPVAAASDDNYTVYDANTDSLPHHLYPSADYYENYTIMYNEGTWGVIPPGLGVSAFIPCHTTFFNPRYKSESCEAPLPPDTIPSHSTLTMRLSVNLRKCFPDEVYDSESHKCRKIICPNPGEKFRYGRCAPKQGDATPSTQEQESLCSLSDTCFEPSILVSDRGCFCDDSCKVYGDCCRDSQYYDEAQQTRNLSVCVEYYQKESRNGGLCKEHIYMKATCSEHWNNTDVQALCMKGNTIPDILNGVPISKVSGRTYVNAYCAICNGEDLVYVHRWESYVVCDGTPVAAASDDDYTVYDANTDSLPHHLYPSADYYENYTIMYNEGTWGVIPPGLDGSAFIPCYTTLLKLWSKFESWETLLPPDTTPSHPTLTMRLSVNFNKCFHEEVYDSLSDKCRKIICPNPGENFFMGRCVAKVITQETQSYFRYSRFLDSIRDRGCFYNASCKVYGHCCHDSQYYDEAQQTRNLYVYVEYYQKQSWNGVHGLCKEHTYMKVTCSEYWNNTDVQALCMKGNTIPDILKGVPGRMLVSGRTYLNTYCAICNGEHLRHDDVWESYAVCDGTPVAAASDDDYTMYDANTDSLPHHLYPSADYYENYTIMYNEGTWGVIPPGLGVSAFIPCHTTFFNPRYKSESCEAPLPPDTIPSHSTLTMRLSVNLRKCFPDEVYDSESHKCRKIICPNPGEKFRYGRCAPKQGDATPSTQEQDPLCPFDHSCFDSRIYKHRRGCFCDASCKVYGDCCRDSQYYDQAEQIKNMNTLICYNEVYMKTKCSEAWDDAEVETLCLKGNETPDHAKLFPVTSTTTSITYVNYYCAVCNGENTTSLIVWYVNLMCSMTPLKDYRVAFHKGSWGIIVPDLGLQSFTSCPIDFKMPIGIKNYTRQCEPYMVKSCPSWAHEHDLVLCQSYAATVYHELSIFRNQHCAACNGYERYQCFPTMSVKGPVSVQFSVILDFTDHHGSNLVGLTRRCDTGEVWDTDSHKCRKVLCSNSGEKFSQDLLGCVSVEDDTSNSYTITSTTSTTSSTVFSPITGMIKRMQTFTSRNMTVDAFPIRAIPPHHQIVVSTASSSENNSIRPSTATETNTSHPVPTSGVNISLSATQAFDDCPKMLLYETEFTIQTNGSLYVPAHGRMYQDDEYEAMDGGVLVCWSGNSELEHKFSSTLGWVSVVGLSLSCLALVLHLTAFCLVPSLRKLSGKCLASLCVSLLSAYITLLLNVSAESNQAGCVILAVARYYFLLCYFAWMTAIAFDVWYTFCLTHTQLRVANGTENSRFLPYSLCSWLLPAVCTAVLVAVDQLEPQGVSKDFLPRLGKSLCWISHRKSLLVFFVTPFAVFTLLNVVFFVSTTALIAKMSRNTAATATPAAGSKRRQRYWSFLRLAVLMGLTWIIGILAGWLNLEPLWYVFVVLNSLQGVFIFLAFTCRSQVLQAGLNSHTLLQHAVSLVFRRSLHPPTIVELHQVTISSPTCSSALPSDE